MPSKLPQIGVRVAPALFERLREVAAKDGRSLSNFVAQHLQAHFGTAPRKKRPLPADRDLTR
jgi:predicted HicB family RNase H-like nuclease